MLIKAPLALTWDIASSRDTDPRFREPGTTVLAEDPERHAVVLRITTPPDLEGRTWTYSVERQQDPLNHTVYARRWGNPSFNYSHAFWSYREVPGGTELRCVQDFETTPEAPVDDTRMEQIIRRGTERAMLATAALCEAAAGGYPLPPAPLE